VAKSNARLRLSVLNGGAGLRLGLSSDRRERIETNEGVMNKSDLYRITDCPIPTGEGNYHEGLDVLLSLMSDNGLKLYQTDGVSDIGGPDGWINKEAP